MPELPEVETVRRQLGRIVGERIETVEVIGARTVRRQDPDQFCRQVRDTKITGVRRWGKFLLLDLSSGEVLVIHLRMSGQLVYLSRAAEPQLDPVSARHLHAVFALSSGAQVRFFDQRTFGELFVATDLDARGLPAPLSHLGRDPIVAPVGADELWALAKGRRVALKTLLLDQTKICGIGNIYADEICHLAGVRPTRRSNTLRRAERAALATAVPAVLEAAIAARGSTLSDERYRDLDGSPGGYQVHHRVYGRAGLACSQCGTLIVRTVLSGRSAHFCPSCQR